ncbi:MAG: hypothetical protein MUC47_09390 [Candidatus Kapabacteria bacterium]|nr:hypothetical protein [Candidatus Kapabacteria bacterium]
MARPHQRHLWDLVHSLSSGERGYVRKVLSTRSGRQPDSILRVFDAVIEAKDASDPSIDLAVRQTGTKSNPATIKRYLYEQILRSLRSSSERSSVITQVLGKMLDANLLFHRGLPQAASERFQEAASDSSEREYSLLLAECIRGRIGIEKLHLTTESEALVSSLMHQMSGVLEVTSQNLMYQIISRRLLAIDTQHPMAHDEIMDIRSNPLLADNFEPASVWSKLWYHHCRAFCAYLRADSSTALQELHAVVTLAENHPAISDEAPFSSIMTNLVATELYFGTAAGFERAVNSLKNLVPTRSHTQEEHWYVVRTTELFQALVFRRYNEIDALERPITKECPRYHVRGELVSTILSVVKTMSLWQQDRIQQARSSALQVMGASGVLPHYLLACQVVELCTYLQEGDETAFRYRLRSIRRGVAADFSSTPSISLLLKLLGTCTSSGKTVPPKKRVENCIRRAAELATSPAERSLFTLLGRPFLTMS